MQDYIPRGIDINGTIDTVEVRQYDNNSRFIRVKLRDDDLAEDNNTFDLSDCTTALYIRAESGGNVSFISGTVESPSGVVTFLIPGSVTQVAGNYLCQIRIYEGDDTDRPVISSKPFRLTVDESIAEDAAIEATPDYSALTVAMTNFQAVKNQMAALVASPAGSGGDVGTELRDVRIGYDGAEYESAGDAVRGQIGDIRNDLRSAVLPYNPFDLLSLNSIATNGTHNGVTYTFSGNQCTVTGTSTGASFKNICDSGSRLPDGMTAGKPIYCKYCTDDNNVRLALAFRDENNAQIGSMQYLITDRVVTVPQNAVRFIARIDVPLGKTVNSTVEFAALTELTRSDMESQIEQLTTDVTAMQTNDNEMKATLNDLATENLLLPAYESDNETTVHHGITYQKVNGRYHIFGTATGISFHDIYANTEQLPSWLEKNRQYYVNYQAEKVRFIILPVGGSSDTSLINHIAGGIFVIPADVTGVYIRLWVADGETVNESVFPYVSSYEPSATQLVEINKVAGPRYVYADTSKTATGKLIHAHNVKPMTAINVSGFNATSNLIVCGKNLYRNPHGLTTYQGNGVTITFSETAGTINVDSDGATGNVTGPATFSTLNDANWRCQFKFSLPRDTVVTFSENSNADGFEYSRCYCEISNGVDSIKLTGHPATLNMKANVEYGLRIHVSTGFSGSVTFKPQIEINEFPTEFEPFSGIIYNNGDSIVLNERTTSPACIMTATNFANMISYNEPATVTYRAAYAVDRIYQDYVNRVKQVGEKPMLLSFVDDDTSSLANVQLFHDALAEIGVVGSFAAITNNLQNDPALVSTLLQYEAEGFGICCHASNQDGANTDYFRPYEDRDIERVRDNMMTAKRYMQQAGFISGNIWVTPYGVNDEQIRDLARSLGFDGLISTLNYTPVIHGITDRYNIPRYSIERSTDMIKVGMDACTKYGGWVIVTSHAYNWGDNADTYKSKIAELVDYADEIGMKTVNVQEGFETFFGDSQISPSLITEWKSSLINNINSRITANSELIDEIVAQSAYLLPTGDTTDRTAEIVTMLTQTGVCHLGAGVFYVSGIDMPDDAMLTGCGSKTVVRLNGSGSYAVKMSHRNTVSDLTIEGSDSNITLNENVGTRHGILWQGDYTQTQSQSDATTRQPSYGILNNLRIRRFTGGGVTCSDTGYGTINFIEGNNIVINNCNAGINISYWSEFHKFTNVRTYGCYYGCINNGGNNTFVNCDFSTCKLGFLMDNTNGQSPNNSHGSAVGCVFNHTDSNNGVGIKIVNCNNGYIFTGCHIWFSQIYLQDSSGIVVSSSEFGSTNAVITVSGGGAVLFANNMHGEQPTKNITNNSAVRFVNCFLRSDGTAVE